MGRIGRNRQNGEKCERERDNSDDKHGEKWGEWNRIRVGRRMRDRCKIKFLTTLYSG
jgi:hypothetical protein